MAKIINISQTNFIMNIIKGPFISHQKFLAFKSFNEGYEIIGKAEIRILKTRMQDILYSVEVLFRHHVKYVQGESPNWATMFDDS